MGLQQGWRSRLASCCLCTQTVAPCCRASPSLGCREGSPWGKAGPALPSCCSSAHARGWKSPRRGRAVLRGDCCNPSSSSPQLWADKSGAIWGLFCIVYPAFVLLKLISLSTWMPWQNRESLFLGGDNKFTAQLLPQAWCVPVQYFSCSLQSPQVVCISQKLSRAGSEIPNCLAVNRIPFNSLLILTFKMFWCN